MRSLFTVVFTVFTAAACLTALPHAGHGASGALHAVPTVSERLVHEAKFVCGQFEEGFTCKYVPGENTQGARGQHKGPPAAPKRSQGTIPAPSALPSAPATEGGWGATTSQPPSQPPSATAQSCPPNTELLGGNCVPYTARCKNGMALDALPQPCASMEEKQVCKPRSDGLKDCCCITYSKF